MDKPTAATKKKKKEIIGCKEGTVKQSVVNTQNANRDTHIYVHGMKVNGEGEKSDDSRLCGKTGGVCVCVCVHLSCRWRVFEGEIVTKGKNKVLKHQTKCDRETPKKDGFMSFSKN